VVTLTKDARQVRIWTYIVYTRQRTMPPMDELPVNYQHVDPNNHVFLINKKNIHLNCPISLMCLSNELDILAAASVDSPDIALFTMKEGKNLYSLEVAPEDPTSQIRQHKESHDDGYFTLHKSSKIKSYYLIEFH